MSHGIYGDRSRDEREQRKCRLAAIQEKRQCLEMEVRELAAKSRQHASDLNALKANLKHLMEQRDTIVGYAVSCYIFWLVLKHTHLFNGRLSGTTQVSRYRKVKPIWILLKQ